MICLRDIATLLPEHRFSFEDALPYYKQWLASRSPSFQAKALGIFQNAAIERKHTIAPGNVLFAPRSFETSNDLYREKAVPLCAMLLEKALAKAGVAAQEVDYLITTSCTGFMIPSVDAYLVNLLGLRNDVVRMPITEIGCAAGAAGLIYADALLKGRPNGCAVVLSFEFPSNTIQLDNWSWDNVVGTALFADGLACAVLQNREAPLGPQPRPTVIATQMMQVPDTTHILGYNITAGGLTMTLDKTLPKVIEACFEGILLPFLADNNLTPERVDHFLIHPGGIKIINAVEAVLAKYGKNAQESRQTMALHGNMSSATILFILESVMSQPQPAGHTAYVLSFGPGFSADHVLLRWE
jgi:predicted naringenin-chalcone synthase